MNWPLNLVPFVGGQQSSKHELGKEEMPRVVGVDPGIWGKQMMMMTAMLMGWNRSRLFYGICRAETPPNRKSRKEDLCVIRRCLRIGRAVIFSYITTDDFARAATARSEKPISAPGSVLTKMREPTGGMASIVIPVQSSTGGEHRNL